MESTSHYTRVGLTVVLLTAGLIFASLWLSTGLKKKQYHTYVVYMNESIASLTRDSLVKYNGVNVGMIKQIQLKPSDPKQVKLLIQVEVGTPITDQTRATLISQGITGVSYLGLYSKSNSLKPIEKLPGEKYPVIPSELSFFAQIENHTQTIMHSFDRLVSEKNIENFSSMLSNLQETSATISNNNQHINESLAELPKVIESLKKTAEHMTETSDQVTLTMKSGRNASEEVSRAMEAGREASIEVATAMKNANIGVNKITDQALPEVMELIRKLNVIATNLEQISGQMRANPAVIIRGKTPPPSGPGE